MGRTAQKGHIVQKGRTAQKGHTEGSHCFEMQKNPLYFIDFAPFKFAGWLQGALEIYKSANDLKSNPSYPIILGEKLQI